MSLCFDEAFEALQDQRISQTEYLHHVLAHFSGNRHPADQQGCSRSWEILIRDPVGNAIREAALRSNIQKDIALLLEQLFAHASHDDSHAVNRLLLDASSYADSSAVLPLLLQILPTFAALHAAANVLQLCLAKGATLDNPNTSLALELTSVRTPALLNILYAHDWRNMRLSRHAFDQLAEWSLHTCAVELGWFIEHGARVDDRRVLRRASRSAPLSADTMKLMVRKFGPGAFRGSRVLQDAAARGQGDVVRVLLDAGFDVDEGVAARTAFGGDVDDGDARADVVGAEGMTRTTALFDAVDRQHGDVVALLLSHGADPDKEVCSAEKASYNTPLLLAQGRDYASICQALMLRRRGVDGRRRGVAVYGSRL